MKKIILVLVCLLFVTACVQKTGDPVKEKESKRPTASGTAYDVSEVEFYLPEQFTRNIENNRDTYEFFTGKLQDHDSTELYVVVNVKAIDENFKIDNYIKNEKDINYKEKKINKYNWYVAKYDKKAYYASTYRSNLYVIELRKNKDPDNIYNDTIKTFEDTLFFEVIEAK